MSDDLSTRLLQAVTGAEGVARDADNGTWRRQGAGIATELAGIGVTAPTPDIAEAIVAFLEANGPSAFLALCQAHREIVELHMVCQADYALAAERLATYTQLAGYDEATTTARDAFVRLQLSEHIVEIISRGYGITLDPLAGSPREGR